jgi:DNA repair exonuclease SbcCD ATPase subunit
LTSRVAALEKDRDETAKRESDIRRKARDVNSKARRLEDELESINERARALEQDLEGQRSSAQKLQSRLTQAETAAQDAQAELEREKKVWEAELQQRLEDERNRWRIDMQSQMPDAQQQHLRADSPSMTNRRPSPDALALLNRKLSRSISPSMEMPLSPLDRMLDEARRPPSSRQKSSSSAARTPEVGTPQRQNSIPFGMATFGGGGGGAAGPPYTPSIHAVDYDEGGFEAMSSPQRTVHDMVSVSTVGAGPSVQLVERMSAAVRRLESEKATSREEMARLGAQRDEARDEVVALMREVEDKKVLGERVDALERQLKDVDQRYQASLEMLGEKTEQVEELEGDVADLKKMYKELVSTMQ